MVGNDRMELVHAATLAGEKDVDPILGFQALRVLPSEQQVLVCRSSLSGLLPGTPLPKRTNHDEFRSSSYLVPCVRARGRTWTTGTFSSLDALLRETKEGGLLPLRFRPG